MPDPIEELMKQNAQLYDQFVQNNLELERRFASQTTSSFVSEQLDAARQLLGWEPDEDANATELADENS